MAFGVTREEMMDWKRRVMNGEIAFLTHYWHDPRFPHCRTITKVGCANVDKLAEWCFRHGLNPRYIHMRRQFPHFDLLGPRQREILEKERQWEQINRFRL